MAFPSHCSNVYENKDTRLQLQLAKQGFHQHAKTAYKYKAFMAQGGGEEIDNRRNNAETHPG